jgi:protein-S-isoprenylcysteine O-methyltransferase
MLNLPLSLILGVLLVVSELLLVWRRHSSKVAGSAAADSGTILVLWGVAFLSIAGGLFVALQGIGPRFPAGFPWRAASLAVFGLGTAFRWWAISHLGRFFTVDITVRGDHKVIDDGPYRYLRHPSYTGLLVQFVGWALSLNNLVALPVVIIPVFFALVHRIRNEEAALSGALGEHYAAYSLHTKRLVPWVY